MTSIRTSAVYAPEDTFCGGKPSSKQWIAPPPGTFISFTLDRAVSKVYSEGSKFYDVISFNQVSGSFSWNFIADYDYIEPFFLLFESYSVQNNGDGTYTHTFSKVNNSRVGSFCMRVKQLNRMAGGIEDEVTEMRGCVPQSIKLTYNAGTSQVQVSISGKFADAYTWIGDLTTTDYQEYDGNLMEFGCLFVGATATDEGYVEMVDSLSVTMDNGLDLQYSVCTPFAVQYYEGANSFSMSASCYSNDPRRFKLRTYTGGQSVATGSPASMQTKSLRPCADMVIASYSLSIRDGEADDFASAVSESKMKAVINIEDCVFKTAQWPASDNSKMQEQISSAECRKMSLSITNDIPDLRTTNSHPVTSPNPT